jgi:hypothetical protein
MFMVFTLQTYQWNASSLPLYQPSRITCLVSISVPEKILQHFIHISLHKWKKCPDSKAVKFFEMWYRSGIRTVCLLICNMSWMWYSLAFLHLHWTAFAHCIAWSSTEEVCKFLTVFIQRLLKVIVHSHCAFWLCIKNISLDQWRDAKQ